MFPFEIKLTITNLDQFKRLQSLLDATPTAQTSTVQLVASTPKAKPAPQGTAPSAEVTAQEKDELLAPVALAETLPEVPNRAKVSSDTVKLSVKDKIKTIELLERFGGVGTESGVVKRGAKYITDEYLAAYHAEVLAALGA